MTNPNITSESSILLQIPFSGIEIYRYNCLIGVWSFHFLGSPLYALLFSFVVVKE